MFAESKECSRGRARKPGAALYPSFTSACAAVFAFARANVFGAAQHPGDAPALSARLAGRLALLLGVLLTSCALPAAAADFFTTCGPEADKGVPYAETVKGYNLLQGRFAGADVPALPMTLGISRAQCRLDRQRAYFVARMDPVGAFSRFPKVTVVQNGKALGWFGAEYAGGAVVRSGQGFSWAPAAVLQEGIFQKPLTFAVKPDEGIAFDPLDAFELKVEYTYDWPAGTPAMTLAVPAAPLDQAFYPVSGYWADPEEPGWGLLTQRNSLGTVFALWFTFDEDGKATWFYMPNGQPVARGVVEGDVYSPEGPAYGTMPFDTAQFRPGDPVGRFRIGFPSVGAGPAPVVTSPDATSAVNFHYEIRGLAATKSPRRLIVETQSGRKCDAARMLWNERESGWGLAVAGGIDMAGLCGIHAVWATYGSDRKPTWLFAPLSAREVVIPQMSVDLHGYAGIAYEVRGPYYGAPYAPEKLRIQDSRTTFRLDPQRRDNHPYAFFYTPGRAVSLIEFYFEPYTPSPF